MGCAGVEPTTTEITILDARKTADVVINVSFGEPTMAVDTHLFRVASGLLIRRSEVVAVAVRPSEHRPEKVRMPKCVEVRVPSWAPTPIFPAARRAGSSPAPGLM